MSLRIEDDQLIFDCCYMTKNQFFEVYSSWFFWDKEKSFSVYKSVREYIVDREVVVRKSLKKSRKQSVKQRIQRTPSYKFIEV